MFTFSCAGCIAKKITALCSARLKNTEELFNVGLTTNLEARPKCNWRLARYPSEGDSLKRERGVEFFGRVEVREMMTWLVYVSVLIMDIKVFK